MDIYLKSDSGYVKKELTQEDYLEWFKSNTNEKGDVTEDCLLYKDADLKINTDKSVTFVMSDDSLDRDFERFDTAGWDLKKYKKNPVLLWSHDRSIPAIGKMEKVRVKDNRLLGNPVFDPNDELAIKLAGKVQTGIIKSGSVGFFPSKIEFNDDEKDPCRLTYLKQELREFSICNVPANPNALVLDEPGKTTVNVIVDGKSIGAFTESIDEKRRKQALKEIPGYHNHVYTLPVEDDDMRIESSVVTLDDRLPKEKSNTVYNWTNMERIELHDLIEEMKVEIEIIKTMQMKMAETVVKEDRNYYAELLETKKPKPSGLKELLKQRRLH